MRCESVFPVPVQCEAIPTVEYLCQDAVTEKVSLLLEFICKPVCKKTHVNAKSWNYCQKSETRAIKERAEGCVSGKEGEERHVMQNRLWTSC
jgi:hypothetical protein